MMPPAKNKPQNVNTNPIEKFNEVHARNIEVAKKLVENFASSSEDEDELDEKTIIDTLYKNYEKRKEDEHLLAKTAGFLENALRSGAATCLICIASIKRADSIWSCKHCYCFFHLNCIRRWSNDSMAQIKAKTQNDQQGYYNHMGEYVPPKKSKNIYWCCPQCRKDFTPEERPSTYECFCGSEINPPSQPWLVPHSCGEICGKLLQPSCGHKCTLLCHPGPCPPCAQYARTSCKCGKSAPKSVRCIDKQWECEQKCDRLLKCGEHVCGCTCHKAGQCPPCNQTSMQSCECGRGTAKRPCYDLEWHCKNVCNQSFSCSLHKCKKVCHAGECGQCPLSLPRSCPCGKTKKIGPCSEVIDTCGDTCQKVLPCGLHTCTQRCHKGNCNLCLVIINKKCRCGLHEKELPCSKEFACETKCKQIRDCDKHPCNRKCCDKNCPPCDKVCGKPLSCGKHKCQSVCHKGPCYPCQQQSQINCRCGKTKKSVPCGRERTARVVCLEQCRIPSKCHHNNKHRCHKSECKPCSQPCGLLNDTTNCGHICTAKCHASVKVVKKTNPNNASVWEPTKQFEFKCLPHPRCEQKVKVMCIGGHEVAEWPCWNSKPTSCQRRCKRQLKCGNHKCSIVCHSVLDREDMNQQDGCAPCRQGCHVPRAEGCNHNCPKPCHVPPCNPCIAVVKTKCHCGLMSIGYKCSDFYNNDGTDNDVAERQENLKSCGNRCLKNYPCGHRCSAVCHSGPCPYPDSCRKKVRIYCDCKRLKSDVSCDKIRTGLTEIQCDQNCVEIIKNLELDRKRELDILRKKDEERNRLEVEQFEKKFSKRKPKERKTVEVQNKKPINWNLVGVYAGIRKYKNKIFLEYAQETLFISL